MIHKVYSSRGADLASSHYLLICTLKLKLGSKFHTIKNTHQAYDRGTLNDSDTAYYFKEYIREQLAAWNPMRDDVDASWEYLHRSIVEALL